MKITDDETIEEYRSALEKQFAGAAELEIFSVMVLANTEFNKENLDSLFVIKDVTVKDGCVVPQDKDITVISHIESCHGNQIFDELELSEDSLLDDNSFNLTNFGANEGGLNHIVGLVKKDDGKFHGFVFPAREPPGTLASNEKTDSIPNAASSNELSPLDPI